MAGKRKLYVIYMRSQKRSLQNDDELSGTENQIQLSINRLFNPPKNRILTNDQWQTKCKEIVTQIKVAVKFGRIPEKYLTNFFVRNLEDYFIKGIVTKPDYISQFQAVSDYLEEQEHQPDDVQIRDYRELMGDA